MKIKILGGFFISFFYIHKLLIFFLFLLKNMYCGFHKKYLGEVLLISTHNGSKTYDSFTIADSNSFLSPCKILLIVPVNKY